MAIKKVDPKAVFKVVTAFDDAILFETEEELAALKTKGKDGKEIQGPTRMDKYLESMDYTVLKFKEDSKPTIFHVRCLLANELAEINQKYQKYDVINKKVEFTDRNKMMLEIFDRGVIGMENSEGKLEKVLSNDLEYPVGVDLGSIISLITTLGKNLKKI